MNAQCPECKNIFFGASCSCGFQYSTDLRSEIETCAWKTEGRRCKLNAMVSYSIGVSNMYCGFHFDALTAPGIALSKDKFAEWVLFRSPELLDSDQPWISYYWNRANGIDALRPRTSTPEIVDGSYTGAKFLGETAPNLFAKLLTFKSFRNFFEKEKNEAAEKNMPEVQETQSDQV